MGERILVDTDILIDYYRNRLGLPPGNLYYISLITLYEYIRGTKSPAKAKKLLEESFSVIPLTNKILEEAASIWRDLKDSGLMLDDRDLIIGTTAIVYGLKLYTRNLKHFERLEKYGLTFYTLKNLT
ncbi:MAG TPA: type II toxin-antitoxin system VapC family toxin [Thermoproteales archaeon]|nr:type II toxin-antitoxin system VapC family toxin [Thermoproteales archaeon]